MIKVERANKPKILEFGVHPQSAGESETLDAIDFFSEPNNRLEPFKQMGQGGNRLQKSYSVYSDSSIRKKLKEIFNGKCAYCESKISSIYSGDIEHFRPKGRIKTLVSSIKPGYYWLAADWNNLLFACPFCNQTYTHEIDKDGVVIEVVLGKLDQFPIDSELYRLNQSHGQLFLSDIVKYEKEYELEERFRLLLKPCTDEVDKFFKYEDDGRILPSDELTTFERKQAETSIKVYALERLGLIQAREEKIIQIKAQIRRVEEAIININRLDNPSNDLLTWYEGILRREMKVLKNFTLPSMEYSGLAKYIIDKYFKTL